MRWDLFCQVIDNHGDIGVCWRLARELAARGELVRLWLDDPSALAWMAPDGAPGVEVRRWPDGSAAVPPGEVVIEAFGCELPPSVVADMARCRPWPVWINLEYLSAQAYVERSHGLRSPQAMGPAAGLDKWFYYPGFTSATGGLLREADLDARLAAFDRNAWLAAHRWAPLPDEQLVVLFAYDHAALAALVDAWRDLPTLLLACPGPLQQQLDQMTLPPALRWQALPWLSQREFDHLLWSADLNFVRGEDSFVRAMWAGLPFVWQAYPQADGAHAAKLEAFLDRLVQEASPGLAQSLRHLWRAWNGLAAWPDQMPERQPWRQTCLRWRSALWAQPDLATQLLRFVDERR